MTANPWPSSDWVAFVSERGFVPTLALLGGSRFVFRALRRWSGSRSRCSAGAVRPGRDPRGDDGRERVRRRAAARGSIVPGLEHSGRDERNPGHGRSTARPRITFTRALALGLRRSSLSCWFRRCGVRPNGGDVDGRPRRDDSRLGIGRNVGFRELSHELQSGAALFSPRPLHVARDTRARPCRSFRTHRKRGASGGAASRSQPRLKSEPSTPPDTPRARLTRRS